LPLVLAPLLVLSLGASDPFALSEQVDISALAASGILLGASQLWTQPAPASPPSPKDLWPIDRVALKSASAGADWASTVLQDALIVAAPLGLFAGGRGDSRLGLKLAFIEVEVLLASAAASQFVKAVAQRPRPGVYGGAARGGAAYESFYSGHTSVSFAAVVGAATLYTSTFPGDRVMPWVFLAGAGAAASVGVLRVAAGKHFPTDVLVGAAAGSLIGWAIPTLHRRSGILRLSAGPGGLGLQGRF
jgi:membrane-associated phospholipid phosphatase